MACDERLAARVRGELGKHDGIRERRMFGGIAFLMNGHMACGVLEDRLVLRLGAAGATAALRERHTAPMDFTGRPMTSMVYVASRGVRSDAELRRWLGRAIRFARTLPPKP